MLEKFELEKFEISDVRHYRTPEGVFPSVTAVLSSTKDAWAKANLAKWRATKTDAEALAITERGSVTHSLIENYLLTGEIEEVPDHAAPFWTSIEPELSRVGRIDLIEGSVWHPSGFAGSVDFVGEWDGELVTLDWKTSSKKKESRYIVDYKQQVAAYTAAINRMYGLKIRRGVVVVAVENQKAQTFVIEGKELMDAWREFQFRLATYQDKLNWRRNL